MLIFLGESAKQRRERERKREEEGEKASPSTSFYPLKKTKTFFFLSKPQRLLSLSEIISLDDFLVRLVPRRLEEIHPQGQRRGLYRLRVPREGLEDLSRKIRPGSPTLSRGSRLDTGPVRSRPQPATSSSWRTCGSR